MTPAAGNTRNTLWLSFVKLSLAMAIGPGFLTGAVMLLAIPAAADIGAPHWYASARQAHGHAQLMGWSGAMILGVGLHFLPRLRGSKRTAGGWAGSLFWLFAGGMVLRVVGPLALPLIAPEMRTALTIMTATGTWLEALGGIGLVAMMIFLLGEGPPLKRKQAFAQLVPMLGAAGTGFVVALLAWSLAAAPLLFPGAMAPVLHAALDELAVYMLSFVFLPAICLGMSARVFPLFYRTQLPDQKLLRWSALLLAAGAAAILMRQVTGDHTVMAALAMLSTATGMLVGILAIKVFHPRVRFPGDRGKYSPWKEPAALAVVTAYAWGCAAAAVLFLIGLARLGLHITPGPVSDDLAIHAVGAGLMTLLILGVAPIMLPGFGGAKPTGDKWIWAAMIAGNIAVFLRVLPLAGRMLFPESPAGMWAAPLFTLAGLLGVVAVICLTVQLWLSLRPNIAAIRA